MHVTGAWSCFKLSLLFYLVGFLWQITLIITSFFYDNELLIIIYVNRWNTLTSDATISWIFWFFFCIFSSSFDGPDDDSSIDMHESDGGRSRRDSKSISREVPIFLSCATPDEFLVWFIFFLLHHGQTLSLVNCPIYLFIVLNSAFRNQWQRQMLLSVWNTWEHWCSAYPCLERLRLQELWYGILLFFAFLFLRTKNVLSLLRFDFCANILDMWFCSK